MPIDPVCPYCNTRPATSDDHVFPEFLGGSATVRACKQCNDTFGHRFEARISQLFAPYFVILGRSGVGPRRDTWWRKAFQLPGTDLWADMCADGSTTLSKPDLKRDDKGKVVGGRFPSTTNFAKHPALQRPEGNLIQSEDIKIPPLHMPRFPLDHNIRRLALKMAIGVSNKLSLGNGCLSPVTREFLQTDGSASHSIQFALSSYDALDRLRPALSHMVYVEGNAECHHAHAVVQFFGTLQFYVPLNDQYTGPSVAGLGVLDPVGKETFTQTQVLNIVGPPRYLAPHEFEAGYAHWSTKLTSQMRSVTGDSTMSAHFRFAPPEVSPGVRVVIPPIGPHTSEISLPPSET